jgi:hypothetical protein
MRNFKHLAARVAVGAAALPLFALASTGTAHAGIGTPPTLTGVVSCDTTTGHQVVTWTFTNSSGSPATIDSSVVSGPSGGGTTIDTSAVMSPTDIANGGTSTGTTRASGDATGDYHLEITYTLSAADPIVDGEVVLPGGCVAVIGSSIPGSTTTTATGATTTSVAPATTVAPAAVAVTAQPTFTG